jgi:hypothetical protein
MLSCRERVLMRGIFINPETAYVYVTSGVVHMDIAPQKWKRLLAFQKYTFSLCSLI